MFKFVIAIPSHGRSKTIKENTLNTLEFYEIDKKLIHIFVAPEEVFQYKTELPDHQIIASVLGLANQRNFIREFFPEETKILYLDDDISGFVSICDQSDHSDCSKFNKGANDYLKQVQLVDLKSAIEAIFAEMILENVFLGGIYPIANGFFMSHRATTKLSYIVGCCYAEINKKDIKYLLEQEQDYGEDYFRTLIHYTNHGIVRLNWIAPKTKYFRGAGGLNDERTIPRFMRALDQIQCKFPNLCRIKLRNEKFPKLILRASKSSEHIS